MSNYLTNLRKGIYSKVKNIFYRPLNSFDIGWIKEKFLKHQSDLNLKYHIYKNKYKIAFRNGPVFIFSINELFVEEFYKFKTPKDRPKIIDCGSYIGTSILYFKINYPNADVIGFEPDESNYAILKENLDNWNFSDTKVLNAAVWVKNGTISFHSTGNMVSKIETGIDKSANIKTVNSVRLNDLLIEEIDFLKIDIEGAEYEVLKDCQDNLINVQNLFIEYHGNYDEIFKLNEIFQMLLQKKFKYYIKEADVVYAKPFWNKEKKGDYDMLLNIFAFRE